MQIHYQIRWYKQWAIRATISPSPSVRCLVVCHTTSEPISIPWVCWRGFSLRVECLDPSRRCNLGRRPRCRLAMHWLRLVTSEVGWFTLWWTNIAMERSTIFNGKIHYFYGHTRPGFGSIPEKNPYMITSWICCAGAPASLRLAVTEEVSGRFWAETDLADPGRLMVKWFEKTSGDVTPQNLKTESIIHSRRLALLSQLWRIIVGFTWVYCTAWAMMGPQPVIYHDVPMKISYRHIIIQYIILITNRIYPSLSIYHFLSIELALKPLSH